MRIKGKLIFTWICLLFALAPSSCAAPRPLGLPFSVSQVEKIELYRFVIPAQARKKTISEAGGIQWIYGAWRKRRRRTIPWSRNQARRLPVSGFVLAEARHLRWLISSRRKGKNRGTKGKKYQLSNGGGRKRLWDGFSDEEETPASVSELPAI